MFDAQTCPITEVRFGIHRYDLIVVAVVVVALSAAGDHRGSAKTPREFLATQTAAAHPLDDISACDDASSASPAPLSRPSCLREDMWSARSSCGCSDPAASVNSRDKLGSCFSIDTPPQQRFTESLPEHPLLVARRLVAVIR